MVNSKLHLVGLCFVLLMGACGAKDEENGQSELHAGGAAAIGAAIAGSIKIDPLAITDRILQAVYANDNRASQIKGILETSFFEANLAAQKQGKRPYNVMVFNLAQHYQSGGLRGVVYFKTFRVGDLTFGVWIFEDGVFHNHGDGGWINWAFKGWHDHTAGQGARQVNFYRP